MTFNEAIKHKKQFLKDSSNYTQSLYHCIITPSKKEEHDQYVSEFKKSPSSFIDESCKMYSSDSDFKVIVMPKNQIPQLQNEEKVSMNMID
ncbi:hypothetical protein ABEG63_02150 [Chryseobacterium sp. C39-AII1]|uniref:hypothetical protein n=1 Tax=Chryseobacterium sp. C39-AII1 TaxID=3080332 RepID=UPI00320A94F5